MSTFTFSFDGKIPVTKSNMLKLMKSQGFDVIDDNCVSLNGALFEVTNYEFKDGITSIGLERIYRKAIFEALNGWYQSYITN